MDPTLAFADAAAGHPARRGFPPPAIIPEPFLTRDDLRFFLMSFVSGFVAVYTLIA